MSWNAYHRRGETLRSVIDIVNDRRDGVLPVQAPGVAQNFTDELDLVGALLLKWHARLSANLDRALALEPMDLASAVASAWRTTAEQMPGVRLVIDRCAQAPEGSEMQQAMTRASEREWARLAAASGLANDRSPLAVELGRRVEARAREGLAVAAAAAVAVDTPDHDLRHETAAETGHQLVETTAPDSEPARPEVSNGSFVDRIKAALAA